MMIKVRQKVLIVSLIVFMIVGNFGLYVKADSLNSNSTNRIYGIDRYATANAVAKKGWNHSDTVVIASGVDFPDALCAGPLAKKYNAPILLADVNGLSDETIDEVKILNATKVIIVGGKGAISSNVEIQLRGIGITSVQRIGGTDRYATSVLVAQQLNRPSAAIIVSGNNYPDALSISPIASQQGMPIILSSKNTLSNYAITYINNNQITKTYIVGGTAVLSDQVENTVPNPLRLSGYDRFDTNLAVLNEFTPNLKFNNIYISSGNGFADALAGSQLASQSQSPIILASNDLTDRMTNYIKGHISANTNVIAIGGNNSVNDSIIENVLEMYQPVTLGKISLLADDSYKADGYNQGCWFDEDKNELSIGGKNYLNDYSTESNKSNILCGLFNYVDYARYSMDLDGKYSRLTAIAGIDDNSKQKQNAKMNLEIIADGCSLFNKELKFGEEPVNIDINLNGCKNLLIKVTDTGGSTFLSADLLDILGMKLYKN